jgi:hypothetical protein
MSSLFGRLYNPFYLCPINKCDAFGPHSFVVSYGMEREGLFHSSSGRFELAPRKCLSRCSIGFGPRPVTRAFAARQSEAASFFKAGPVEPIGKCSSESENERYPRSIDSEGSNRGRAEPERVDQTNRFIRSISLKEEI